MDDTALEELTQSVREHGVIQPLLVTELPRGEPGAVRYRLIAGERRLRAATAAGLTRVPVTVRETTDRDQLELALIENVQREDLSPIEEARAYRRLIDDFGMTQQQTADRIGCSRAKVANRLRLLELAPEVLAALQGGRISEGHARALLAAPSNAARLEILARIEREGLSVRQTERLAREAQPTAAAPTAAAGPVRDPDLEAVEDALRLQLGTKVGLRPRPRRARHAHDPLLQRRRAGRRARTAAAGVARERGMKPLAYASRATPAMLSAVRASRPWS